MVEIFYEDRDMIVVKKPVGMEAQSTHSFAPDLVSEIRKHISRLSTAGGEPYVGVIHRLDKPVGGIMVYAKTRQAAAALSRQVQDGKMQKMYMAVVCGRPVDNVDNFVDYLLKDKEKNLSKIVEKGINGAKRAELRYEVMGTVKEERVLALVKVWLITGRHHQIRVQFAGHGMPLWGDSRYNPEFAGMREPIGLSACELKVMHPVTGEEMRFWMEPEGEIFGRFKPETLSGAGCRRP